MLGFELSKTLRKYWYIAVLLLAGAALLVYVLHHTGTDPIYLLMRFGYPFIILLTFLEGETIVIVAGSLSKSIGLRPELIALCAFCGSFASDQLMFTLGKYKGEAVLQRLPKLGRKISRASLLFKKYDTILILGFRFVYGVRNVTPIMLGISGVSHKKFFSLNFIGAAVWALSFTYGGLYLGKAFLGAMHWLGKGVFFAILAAILIFGLIWYIRFRQTKPKHEKVVLRYREIAAFVRAQRKEAKEKAVTGKPPRINSKNKPVLNL